MCLYSGGGSTHGSVIYFLNIQNRIACEGHTMLEMHILLETDVVLATEAWTLGATYG